MHLLGDWFLTCTLPHPLPAHPSSQSELFRALEYSKLVEDVKMAQYSKCGRTDKGVSALSQV